MSHPASHHDNKIGLIVATALSVTVVLGAGILALPGISYLHAGRHGHWPWIIMAVVMLPLLAIFSHFGRHHPSAGGVVGYVRVSLGARWAAITEMIVLGTLLVGLPSISLIGASYFSQFFGGLPDTLVAWLIISTSAVAALIGLRLSGPVQTLIAVLILLGLLIITGGFLLTAPDLAPALSADPTHAFPWMPVLHALPAILFAYTGWELTAFLAEDMRSPQRDLPRSIWISFILVSALYLLMAWAVATHAKPTAGWYDTPIAQLAEGWLGSTGRRAVGLIAALLVLANVMAAFLSTSRAMFSAGRDGLLPGWLATRNRHGTPVNAILLTWAACSLTLLIAWLTSTPTHTLLQLVGQNFFVLYLLAAIGYVAKAPGMAATCQPERGSTLATTGSDESHDNDNDNDSGSGGGNGNGNGKAMKSGKSAHGLTPTPLKPYATRMIGSLAILSVLGMMSLFQPLGMLYCGLLAAIGYVGARWRGH